MSWVWVGFFGGAVLLPLLVPIKLCFMLEPFQVHFFWGPWVGDYRESRFQLRFLGLPLAGKKKNKQTKSGSKKAKKPRSAQKTKKKRLISGWPLVKTLWGDPTSRLLLVRLKRFMLSLFKSLRLSEFRLVYGCKDPFVQGNVAAFFAMIPQSKNVMLHLDFERETQLHLTLKFYVWRLLLALLTLITRLPYLKARRLYVELKQPV